METKETKKQNRFKDSISLKLTIVIVLSLLLLIPSFMVKQLIHEREQRNNQTKWEITSKWGGEQTITGPILVVPYEKITKYKNGNETVTTDYFQILPSKLKIDGYLDTDIRHRGIYDVLIYTGNYKITGNFAPTDFKDWPATFDNILWNEAKIVVGITDSKGISKMVHLKWNSSTHKFSPGTSNTNLVHGGIQTGITVNPALTNSFSIDLSLNGSQSAFFTPLGNDTEVNLASDWNTPSFDGQFISTKNEVTDTSFTAQWITNELNRPYPQIIKTVKASRSEQIQSLGVNLKLPVDTYQKSERSVKYAFLFIALTFLIVFFSEITKKIKVHPIQYLIIGLGLVIFYSLLIALAEHICFNISYLIASLVIIGMTTGYTQALFKNRKSTLIVSSLLTILYAYLFTILQIADYALILGNIGLVIILGLVMIFSRKVDWYGLKNE